MKKIYGKIAIICLIMGNVAPVKAQKGALHLNLNYNYSIPVSGFKSDIVSDHSPRGFMGSLMYSFDDRLSGGLLFGFQDYYQKYPRKLYHIDASRDMSAVLSNSIQTTPLLLRVAYGLLPSTNVKPYISLGAGANLIDFKQYSGEFGSSQTSVGFMAEGGLGVIIPFGKSKQSGFNLGASYDYSPYQKNGYKDLSAVGIQAGVLIEVK